MTMSDALVPGALSLIGQYDSPFVRRVGIALTVAGIPFAHLPWSVFGDLERLAQVNPLMRVPTLVLEDGCVLVDSHAMLDHIDRRSGSAFRPAWGPARDAALRVEGLAVGLAEKAVSLFYEFRLHREASDTWAARCRSQIEGAARALDDEARHWSAGRLTYADITVAAAWRYAREAHPGLLGDAAYPRLAAHAATLEALAPFKAVAQPFTPPA